MKRASLSITLLVAFTLAGFYAHAKQSTTKQQSRNAQQSTLKDQTGDCLPSLNQFDIDINNVRAKLLGGGDMWWDLNTYPKYEVPKGNGTNPLCSIFAGAIWISGLDAGGNLKCAAQRYRDTGNDYWPGPITNGSVTQATCAQYDYHFNCYGADISTAQTAFQNKGSQTTAADIPSDVLAWPAVGNPYLASDPGLIGQTFDITAPLAPFFDNNGDGIYDPTKGDYPVIPSRRCLPTAYADQMVFWVFNDIGNIHTESNGQAIGVQVNALAFSFQSTNDLNNMTFYEYEVTNQSTNKLYQTYMSQWVDPDLGCFSNDRVGCDTTRRCGYCYNGTTPDPDCQVEFGYGTDLPQVGISFFEGPLSDSGTEIGMSSFVYFTNGAAAAQTDPITAAQFRNYQTGFWADGTPFTFGGTGYGGTVPTPFIFPGDPSNSAQWSECQVASILPPGDRRLVESSGPFTLNPGVPEWITIGIPWVRPTGNGVGLCPDINTYLGPVADEAQALFNTCFKLLNGPDAPTLQIRELPNELVINMVNLPGSNNFGESYKQVDGATEAAVDKLLGGHGDSTYVFQGYKLYQVANSTVGATNLNDNTQAVLIAQCDIQDSVATIINYITDPTLGIVPTLEVAGANKGIVNSYNITTDAFATGSNNQLVNHTTYYFAAVAYAYNDYLAYNPNDPTAGGQTLPYLQGRNNFKIYEATPHLIDSRNDGTILNSVWGQGTQVNRIEGQDNGGNDIELTPAAVQAILNSPNGFIDTLAYQAGSDPIGFQITDPVALVEADFELRLIDSPGRAIGDSTRWMLHDLTNNDTIWSDRTLDRPYQQQVMLNRGGTITDYGFSITLGTPSVLYTIPAKYLAVDTSPSYVYQINPNASTVAYADSFTPWLSFVQNAGTDLVTNWIRTGTTLAPATITTGGNSTPNPYYQVFDGSWYGTNISNNLAFVEFSDSNSAFGNMASGAWGPYCLTANYSHKGATIPYVYGPGFKWFNLAPAINYPPINTLNRLQSVDIVITGDKSKWSQCVVLEAGEDPLYNQGGALYQRSYNTQALPNGYGACKGQIRMAYSENWHNPATRDYLVSQSPQNVVNPDTGRSWFPGYAINVETGQRLNIAFSESSDLAQENGTDMLWDPTADVYDPVFQPNAYIEQIPYFGGKHFIYIMDSQYDGDSSVHNLLMSTYDSLHYQSSNLQMVVPKSLYPFYESLMWTGIPYLTQGFSLNGDGSANPAYIPPSDVTVKLRVEKPYNRMRTVATNGDSLPRYQFSTKGLGVTQNNQQVAASALDEIRVVPNPYLAYSAYETGQTSNLIYITNLPNVCTVSIYSLDGKIIRVLNRAIGVDPSTNQLVETTSGVIANTGASLVENSLTWDLTNTAGITVASGVYLVHIDAPGIGQKTIKWFGVIRPADTSNF